MSYLRNKFLEFVEWYIYATKDWAMPWVKKILTGAQIREILETAQEGDLLLVKSEGYWSTLMFKVFGLGNASHCAYVHGYEKITDATRVGISKRDMLDTLVGYSWCAVLRPKFNREEKRKANAKYEELMAIDSVKNIDYNYRLVSEDLNGKQVPARMTCSQFTRLVYNGGRENFLNLRKTLGFMSITPQDYYDAKSKFDIIKEFA